MEVCKIEGCNDEVHGRGWCNKHYKKWLKYGDPGHVVYARQDGPCKIEGCQEKQQTRGLCGAHYYRLWKHGDAEAPIQSRVINKGPCAVEGCERPAKTRGWCTPHYSRWQHYGDPEAGGPLKETKVIHKRELCTWPEGCKELERAKGLCAGHYARARHNADFEYLLPENARAERCIVTDCENPQYAKGFCNNHYEKNRRGQDPLTETDVAPVDYKTFGGRLYALRASRGWTLQDAGDQVGVTRERIRQLEKRATPPQSNMISKLADAFGIDVSVLIGQQIPVDKGSEIKAQKPKISRHIHLRCLWCHGTGELPLASIEPREPLKAMCAYCRGSGAIYISPAPALDSAAANGKGAIEHTAKGSD